MSAWYRAKFIGQVVSILWESSSELNERGWQMEGLSGNYIRVKATAPSPRWNQVDEVRINGLSDDGLAGEILGLE